MVNTISSSHISIGLALTLAFAITVAVIDNEVMII